MGRLAHQQGARDLAPHRLDLLAVDALGREAGHEHLQAVRRGRVAGLAQVRPEDEMLRAHVPDQRGRLGEGHPLRVATLIRNRSEEHTSELQSLAYLVCRLLLEKKKKKKEQKELLPHTSRR